MRSLSLFFSLLVFSTLASAQNSLSGTVMDLESGEPIFGATVFLENTTVGTVTDPDGKFTINGIIGEFPNLVVTHISYFSKTIGIKGRKVINFKLKPKVKQLATVEVEQNKDKKWKRLYARFEEAFIGETKNAEKVEITNPWVMDLQKDEGDAMSGKSIDLLKIENRAIGYELKFLVENFKLELDEAVYQGKPVFTPLEPKDDAEQAAWEEARKRTYLGSRQHFLYALVNDRVAEEGFLMYFAEFDQKNARFVTQKAVTREDIFRQNTLAFSRFLKVIYTQEKPEKAFVKAFSTVTRIGTGRSSLGTGQFVIEKSAATKGQISFLFTRSSRGVQISENGVPKNPQALLEYGYWGWERVAELLPYEYHLELAGSDN